MLTEVATSQDVGSGSGSAADRFHKAYEILLEADAARDNKHLGEAASLYESARDLHLRLLEDYPEWQPGVVAFRAAYCGDQLAYILNARQANSSAAPAEKSDTMDIESPPAVTPIPAAPPAEEIKALARQLIREGRPEEARTLLLEILGEHPDNRDIRALLASAQCRAANFDDAVFVARELVAEIPGDAVSRLILSSAYFGQGRYGEALAELEQVISIDPSIPETFFNAMQVCLTARPPDVDAARKYYEAFLGLGGEPDAEIEKALERPDGAPSVDEQGQPSNEGAEAATESGP